MPRLRDEKPKFGVLEKFEVNEFPAHDKSAKPSTTKGAGLVIASVGKHTSKKAPVNDLKHTSIISYNGKPVACVILHSDKTAVVMAHPEAKGHLDYPGEGPGTLQPGEIVKVSDEHGHRHWITVNKPKAGSRGLRFDFFQGDAAKGTFGERSPNYDQLTYAWHPEGPVEKPRPWWKFGRK